MDLRKACCVYFSPTGTTERAVTAFTEGTAIPYEKIDLTTPGARQSFKRSFGRDELAVVGLPVYGGRLPKNIDNFFSGLKGSGTPAAAVVMYGNRAYEDALIELKMRLEERGFKVIAGAAFIGEHTFSKNVATGRPDAADIAVAHDYGRRTAVSVSRAISGTLNVKGNYPFTANGFSIEKPGGAAVHARIVTMENCTRCGLCADECPWEAIDSENYEAIDYTKCFRCLRCIKICPAAAKAIKDKEFFTLIAGFEARFAAPRKEPELFLAD
jgi:ferredoxin